MLYWVGSGIRRVPTTGGEPAIIADVPTEVFGPGDLAVSDLGVFMSGMGQVIRVPLEGGAADALAYAQGEPNGIALHEGAVYWVNRSDGRVNVHSLLSGLTEVLATDKQGPFDIATDGTVVFWTNAWSGTVGRVSTEGGPMNWAAYGFANPRFLVTVESGIYWTVEPSSKSPGAIMHLAASSDSPAVAVEETGVGFLLPDASHLYWTAASNEGGARVLRMPLGGGPHELIAILEDGVTGFATDERNVYLAEWRGGTEHTRILRVAK